MFILIIYTVYRVGTINRHKKSFSLTHLKIKLSTTFCVIHENDIEEEKDKKIMKPPPASLTCWILER